jgi:predicted secreted hydrolase
VIHGENGVSQKAEGSGHASHYFSFTRLATEGAITVDGKTIEVSELSWMDHEFFTDQLAPDQAGWDWLGVELDDNSELMLYRLHRNDGTADPYSAGTYVDPQGRSGISAQAISRSCHRPTAGQARSVPRSTLSPGRLRYRNLGCN